MITMKDIVKDGTPVLREVAEEVALPASEKDKETLTKMLEYLINSQDPELAKKYQLRSGIGLAAPQIGINKRMFAVHLTDENGKLYSYGLFNPKIVSHSVEQTYLEGGEGCLSVDEDIPGIVPRYARITVTAVDLDGNPVKLRLKGLPSICFQHEIDHLNGVMFYDHIDKNDPFKIPENATKL
ncbi:peptide deformylase [Bacillus taeanensis]|uniref:Peptide deformylase n=1 Tax=Bacillus taeanensis TaxID=273032 RepID=A0A366XVT9_9BACI|nr:peptide deformylase [Bacillus taeanensis]RBW70007.1 peptide deformylase [Bacillus taeanensis]